MMETKTAEFFFVCVYIEKKDILCIQTLDWLLFFVCFVFVFVLVTLFNVCI